MFQHTILLKIGLGLGLGSDQRAMISNCHSEPPRERLKSHMTVERRVINNHLRMILGTKHDTSKDLTVGFGYH